MRAVARQFDRRAAAFATADALHREIESRVFERLDVVRVEARRVLDLGCGPGRSFAALGARFPQASVLGLDVSHRMVERARATARGGAIARLIAAITPSSRRASSRRIEVLRASFDALPIASASIDVAYSNLALHWSGTPHRVLPEWARVLREGGLMAFTCFGPDTMRELRGAAPPGALFDFVDMHDLGDMLIEAGCTAPVMEMERLTLTYPSAEAALREGRALAGNPLAARGGTLRGRAYRQQWIDAIGESRDAEGRIALTVEVIYAHAWRAPIRPHTQRLADGSMQTHIPLGSIRKLAPNPASTGQGPHSKDI